MPFTCFLLLYDMRYFLYRVWLILFWLFELMIALLGFQKQCPPTIKETINVRQFQHVGLIGLIVRNDPFCDDKTISSVNLGTLLICLYKRQRFTMIYCLLFLFASLVSVSLFESLPVFVSVFAESFVLWFVSWVSFDSDVWLESS